ncbi:hypothetical protein NE686_02945 [Tissierella carlieri]|uniref:Uncharacterized protein n=1 Tax=Tissierella carlieri TaxID=689904 RepID=A0ABT1S6D0_9FIRM|nr:hypothetical protein [Tissierella carlieri]MCQ4922030.1 hypothetical protein [Tissierella carlieri]
MTNQSNRIRSMPLFSQTITDFWWGTFLNGDVLNSDIDIRICYNKLEGVELSNIDKLFI